MGSGVLAGGDGAAPAFFAMLPSAFLAIFMWKALFFIRSGASKPGVEINAEDEPELFAFIRDLVDEVNAPRPHKVYLSPDVNAAVFYDLSILNFLFPSKKNLIIGLGLVNSMNRSEFKAVLAHEFGHFAQRSMAVGRWVYVGEQIAGHIIAKRDFLDKTLDFISGIDIRIAWIGWIMRIIVWSIRSLMETVFRVVIIAHRALSREMEFQADLVAVSVTGSDALINGLYRLQSCDGDWQEGIDFMNSQLGDDKKIPDLFAIQTRAGEHRRRILNDDQDGVPPPIPSDAAQHRLFTERLAQPPKMWLTHPPNTEREENAKRTYISAPIDEEPAWSLFERPTKWREALTSFIYESAETEKEPSLVTDDESLRLLDERYEDEYFDPAYRGVYLRRLVAIEHNSAQDLIGDTKAIDDIETELDLLYPDDLLEVLSEHKQLDEEVKLLEAVQFGHLDATGDKLRHRGETIKRREIPSIIADLKSEHDELTAELGDHDRECRTVHLAVAQQVGSGWYEYLKSLIDLLHYAEHSHFDSDDACHHLQNTMEMTLADGHVSGSERQRILLSANDLQGVLAALDRQASQVKLPQAIQSKFENKTWRECLQELDLPKANEHNLGEWLQVVDSWALPVVHGFSALRSETLNELLRTEKRVVSYFEGEPVETAPQPAEVPEAYATRLPKLERPKQRKLDWWSRFTLADGTVPTLLRLSVAASIVAAVVFVSGMVGTVSVYVYNGLATPVTVTLGEKNVTVSAHRHRVIEFGTKTSVNLQTRSGNHLIDSFDVSLDRAFATYVYNVAGAAPMVEWTMNYGTAASRPPKDLGCPKWRTTSVDHIFEEPPKHIETSGTGAVRTVLTAMGDLHPQQVLSMLKVQTEQQRITKLHARYDHLDSKYILYWLMLASQYDGFQDTLESRLKESENEVMILRVQQDLATPETKDAILAEHSRLATEHPDDPDLQYIGIRAMPDGPEQDAAFLDGQKKWPEHVWFNYAAGFQYAGETRWDEALKCFSQAFRYPPLKDTVGDQMARIRRFLAKGKQANLNDLMASIQVKSGLAYESKTMTVQSPGYPYHLLHKGELKHAYRLSQESQSDPLILILLAASEGADKEWKEAALKIPLEEIDDDALNMYRVAIAVQLAMPVDPYINAIEKSFEGRDRSPVPALRYLINNAPDAEFERLLNGLFVRARGAMLATAVALYPDQVSDEWRTAARALLFATERPYFTTQKP